MDATVGVIAGQVGVMFILMMVGLCLFRLGMVTEDGVSQMADIVLYVANPAVAFNSLMGEFSPEVLGNALVVGAVAIVLLLLSVVIAQLVLPGADAQRRVSRFAVIFCNSGFVGIPLVQATLGGEYVFYVSVCNLVTIVGLWTYGVWLQSLDASKIAPRKVLTNPMIVATVLGVIFFVSSLRLPSLLQDSVNVLAEINTGLVMLVLGAYLGMSDIRVLLADRRLYLPSLLRLLAVPALSIALLALLPASMDRLILIALVIYAATPAGANTSLFAHKFNECGELGTRLVAFSTMTSVVTIPVVCAAAVALLG